MQPNDEREFVDLIKGVYAYYRQDYSKFTLGVWLEAMKPFDLAAVRDAMNRHAVDPDRGQFCPRAADVVRLIGGGSADAALMAWAKVERAVRLVGPYQSVVFDDPLIHRVASDMGGWTAFAKVDEGEWPFLRNQFATLYRGYRGRIGQIAYPAHLPGLSEQHNGSGGFAIEPPLMLGDMESCRRVLRLGTDAPMLRITAMPAVKQLTEEFKGRINVAIGAGQ